MKIAKLSLAAAVALGTMTSVAAAKDLSEAIKGVDVTGLLRYEFEGNTNPTDKGGNPGDTPTTPGSKSDHEHDFEINVNFSVPVSEEVTMHVDVEYDEGAEVGAGANEDFTNDKHFTVDNMYGVYAPKAAPVKLMYGKQKIGYTPWSDGDVTVIGGVALYTPMKELTLAAYFFDGHDGDDVDINGLETGDGVAGKTVSDEQLMGLGAIVSAGMVSGDLFYVNITDTADLWAAHLAVDTKFDDVKAGLSGLYRMSSVDAELNDVDGVTADATTDGSGWGIEGYVGVSAVKLSAGWAMAEADEGTTAAGAATSGATALDVDKGSDFDQGEQTVDFFGLTVGEETKYYVGLKGKVMGWKPGITYVAWEREYESNDNLMDEEVTETILSLDYDFTKSFGVDMWYSFADIDGGGRGGAIPTNTTLNGDSYDYSAQDWEVEFDYNF